MVGRRSQTNQKNMREKKALLDWGTRRATETTPHGETETGQTTLRPKGGKGDPKNQPRSGQGRPLADPTKAQENDSKVRVQWEVRWAERRETARLSRQCPEPSHERRQVRVRGRVGEVDHAQTGGLPREVSRMVVEGSRRERIEKKSMQRSKDSMLEDFNKLSFGDRLRFFARKYGCKEDQIEALVERSSKNLPKRQPEPSDAVIPQEDALSTFIETFDETPQENEDYDDIFNNIFPGNSQENSLEQPILQAVQPTNSQQRQLENSQELFQVGLPDNSQQPSGSTVAEDDGIHVYVNVRLRKHPEFKIKKVDTKFPNDFKAKFKDYVLNIFDDDYEIIGIKRTLCVLDKPINFEKWSKNTKNCLNTYTNRIMKPAILKRKTTSLAL